jgi:large subunit ribosomal protein L9
VKVKVLLKEEVKNLGMVGDIVEVAPGYARNYILPNKFGLEVNAGTMQAIEAAQKKRAAIEAERKAAGEGLAETLNDTAITIEAKVSDAGSMYGSVSAAKIVAALADKGVNVEESMIKLDSSIKDLGEYDITVRPYANVEATCKLTVVAAEGGEDDEEEE